MTRIIRQLFALLWLATTCFTGYLAYIITQTERDQQVIWAWFMLCTLAFASASWLTYNIFSARRRDKK